MIWPLVAAKRIQGMLRRAFDYLIGRRPSSHFNARPPSAYYRPAIDALEDRRLMTASMGGDDAPAQIASPLAGVASVVGRNIFYNNSRFDGYDPRYRHGRCRNRYR